MSQVIELESPNWVQRVIALIERWLPVPYSPTGKLSVRDIVIACALGAVAVGISHYTSSQIDSRIYNDPTGFNVWFEADAPRALGAMANSAPNYHNRDEVHPLFSIMTMPLVAGLKALGVPAMQAALGLVAVCGFLATTLLFLALRGMKLPLLPSSLFTAAFLASATVTHWFAIAETSAFAAFSISAALFVLTRVSATNSWAWTLASAFTLAVTITNWVVALAAAIVRLDLKRAIRNSLIALIGVAGLASVQAVLIPGAALFFVPTSLIYEYRYTQIRNDSWTPVENVWSTLVTSAVAPAPYKSIHKGPHKTKVMIVDNQEPSISSYSAVSMIAVASWIIMLGCGILGGIQTKRLHAVFAAASLFLVSQLCLYLVYGSLTFLYATSFFPAMIMLAAMGAFSSMRVLSYSAATVFVLTAAWSNMAQFEAAAALANSILSGT